MSLTQEQKNKLDEIAKSAVEAEKGKIRETIEKSAARSGRLYFPNISKSMSEFDETFSIARLVKAQVTKDARFAEFELNEAGQDWLSKSSIDNNTGAGGGFVVPSPVANDVISYLESKEVVRALGATTYPMTSDTLEVTVDEGGVEAVYVKQSEEGTTSIPNWGLRKFVARDMMVLVPISNSWLSDINPQIEAAIRNRIARAILSTEDRVYTLGSGLGEPQGIVNTTGIQTISSDTLANLDFDKILDFTSKLEAADAEPTGFAMHPEVKSKLTGIQDGVGKYIWWDNPSNPTENRLRGLPVKMSTKLKYTSGGTTYYPIICAQWNQALIGMRSGIEIASSSDVNFYSNRTVIRAIFRHDFKCGQLNAFCVHQATV